MITREESMKFAGCEYDDEKLLPCPFCGSEDVYLQYKLCQLGAKGDEEQTWLVAEVCCDDCQFSLESRKLAPGSIRYIDAEEDPFLLPEHGCDHICFDKFALDITRQSAIKAWNTRAENANGEK